MTESNAPLASVSDLWRSRLVVVCPKCHCPHTETKNYARRIGGVLVACTGIVSALSGAAKGARVGAAFGLRAGFSSYSANCLTAAVLGALAGGVMGCATGAALGQAIDNTVLNNHLCLRCGHSFQSP